MPAITLSSQSYVKTAHESTKKAFPKANPFTLPKIKQISINAGIGNKSKFDGKQQQEVVDYLTKLTGQKPKQVATKKSVANFKTRAGDIVGAVVTLRGKKAEDFLLNLVYISLPRTRDFKGIKETSFDKTYRSFSLGIENASIFPAVGFDASTIFGLQINIVFEKSDPNNLTFLQNLSFPFKK